jgi:D-threonate/D-erythronate kinase
MIAVIADDFTGAAELAGISLRYGLRVELLLNKVIETDADVLVVCTDSRSMKREDALNVTAEIVNDVVKLKPAFIYKKIDSVLRGYVLDEIKVQMRLTEKNKALIFPANPSLKRTISSGEYFIDGKRITETGFVSDPEFPVGSPFVVKMLKDETVSVLEYTNALPDGGIAIAEAATVEHAALWAARTNDSWMLAGAGDFYTALLQRDYAPEPQQSFELQLPHLYVCGTSFEGRKQFIRSINCRSYLPENLNEKWLQETCDIIRQHGKAVIAIDESNESPVALRTAMAKAVKQILERENVKEIFIEGGSTAAALLEELKIKKLEPVHELSRGVVRMGAGDLFITVKPGSYQLPEEILKLYS